MAGETSPLDQEWEGAPIASSSFGSPSATVEITLPDELLIVQRPSRPRPLVPQTPPIDASPQIVQPVVAPIKESQPVVAPAAGEIRVTHETVGTQEIDLDGLLKELLKYSGSDLHMSVDSPPMIRVHGEIRPIPNFQEKITNDGLMKAIFGILTPVQQRTYTETWELDCSYTIPNFSRFRVNILRQKGSIGAVFRVITDDIKPLDELGLPAILYNFAALPRGLVLVTGQTGSGKSTTLASLIDHANRTRSGHIMSIEDPIEFVHNSRLCVVNQREIGVDTHSFAEALKHVLRQDPDIILIGELRDLETIKVAMSAAETGHLVFATLHTQSARDTINRIIDVFPGDQQDQVRSQLATTLKGVVCQTLLKRADGKGRIPGIEIMVVNFPIANLIRNNQLQEIPTALSTGRLEGMQTLDQHLAELYIKGSISRETAEEVATDIATLDAYIGKNRPADQQSGQRSSGLAGGSM